MEITARNDYAFKKLFGRYENKEILIEFVSIVTGIEKEDFEEIQLQDKDLLKSHYEEKYGIVDVKVRLKDGTKINIEMQNIYDEYYPRRSLYYWSKIYSQDLKERQGYDLLTKTISINLLNEKFPKTEKIHSIYRIYEEKEHTLLDDALEIHYLDMSKIKEEEIEKMGILEKWLLFIQTNKQEVRDMIGQTNDIIQKANEVMRVFYSDDIEREIYNTAQKYEMEKKYMQIHGMKKGIEIGINQGRLEGIQTLIETYKCEFNIPKDMIMIKIADKFNLSDTDARMYVEKYY